MSRQILRTALASRDLAELAHHIANSDPDAAERFLGAAEAAFEFLRDTPGAGAPRTWLAPELALVRMWPIRGFEKFLIFYRATGKGIEVLRVIHAARDIPSLFQSGGHNRGKEVAAFGFYSAIQRLAFL